MDKKEKTEDSKPKPEAPVLKPKFGFNPQSFSGGRSFRPSAPKAAGFNPGSFKTQHKG